jgi:SAM-dependent methyltransferase
MKNVIKRIPVIGPVLHEACRMVIPSRRFPGSRQYWEKRYQGGGNSGDGSYRELAEFKAQIVNALVRQHEVRSVIEFGCGDGNQLTLASYPSYLGFDVSAKAVALCRSRFRDDPDKSFRMADDYKGERADLALSLDVVFHLVENSVFDAYMSRLFDSAERLVVVYASNTNENPSPRPAHVRHRKFSAWVDKNRPDWRLLDYIPNRFPFLGDTKTGSFSDFFVYGKKNPEESVPPATHP